MKLSKIIIDLGRAIAFYPGLKKVTGSTTATILLCQFLYWSPKAVKDDGWIWKTSMEIEEETGLTYNEQRTARKVLVDLGILEEKNKRLEHRIHYRINQERVNELWEELSDTISQPIVEEVETPEPVSLTPDEQAALEEFSKPQVPQITAKDVGQDKKGDLVDAVVASVDSPGFKKMRAINEIVEKFRKKLRINVEGKKWERFIEFVYNREQKGEAVEIFLDWFLKENPNPVYWSAERMQMLYPQAFIEKGVSEPFMAEIPETKPEEYAPMPKDIGLKRDLY